MKSKVRGEEERQKVERLVEKLKIHNNNRSSTPAHISFIPNSIVVSSRKLAAAFWEFINTTTKTKKITLTLTSPLLLLKCTAAQMVSPELVAAVNVTERRLRLRRMVLTFLNSFEILLLIIRSFSKILPFLDFCNC